MNFLAPGPALVAAALAVPLLLALYVLKLRRRPLRASTTAFWQVASADAQANVPFQRLRASWMLALHLALLACLLLALARPVLQQSAGGTGTAARTVLLIDASASMAARDATTTQASGANAPSPDAPTRLDRAKRRAKELVRESRRAARAPEIAIVALGAQSELVLGFSASVPMLEAAIESIEQTDQPGDLLRALRLVQSLANEAMALEQGSAGDAGFSAQSQAGSSSQATGNASAQPNTAARQRAALATILLSDGSFVSDRDGQASLAAQAGDDSTPAAADASGVSDEPLGDIAGGAAGSRGQSAAATQAQQAARDVLSRLSLRFERVGPPLVAPVAQASPTVPAILGTASRNVGIVRVAALRDGSVPSRVRVLLALASNSPQETPVTLAIALDGNVVQRTAAIVPASRVSDLLADRSAAKAPDQTANQTSAQTQPPTQTPSPAQPAPSAALAAGDALGTLELVLDVDNVPQGLLTIVLDAGTAPDALATDNTASIVLLPTRTPSVLLLRSQASASSTGALRYLLPDVLEELRFARLEQHIVQGEGQARDADVAARLQNAPWADVAILDDLPLPVVPPMPSIVLGGDAPPLGITRSGEARAWSGLIFWDRQHPLLQGVGFDSLVLGQRLPIALSGASLSSLWRHDILVRDGDDALVVLAQPRGLADGAGARHIVSAFTLRESNWPLSPSFAIFLANATDSLALRDASRVGKALTTSAGSQVRVPASGEVRLVGPVERTLRSGDEAIGSQEADQGTASGQAASVQAAPVVLATGVLPRAGLYRVQTSQAPTSDVIERVLAVNLVNEHETALASPSELSIDNRTLPTSQGSLGERELWPTLLLVALLLLCAEWVLFARQTRA